MRIAIGRRPRAAAPLELAEIVTPRTNTATLAAAENLFASIALAQAVSLEIAATNRRRWFLARAPSPTMRAQLAVAYPQAQLRRLDHERCPSLDPARCGAGEQAVVGTLALRDPPYLPLRTFAEREIGAGPGGQSDAAADPVLGILGALGDLPAGWRALSQLVLRPAPDDWGKGYRRRALEHPLEAERATRSSSSTGLGGDPLLLFLAVGLVGAAGLLQGQAWYREGDGLPLAGLLSALPLGVLGFVWLKHRLGGKLLADPRLVQEKISRPAYQSQLRLAVFAPADVPPAAVRRHLERLAAAYRPFTLAHGNGFVLRPLPLRGWDLSALTWLPGSRALLTTRELAGLWHLPLAGADVPFLERTGARQRLPLPGTVASGCRIGVSVHQGQRVPVALPDDLLRRHLLLVAKTGRGKSTLLLRLFAYLAAQRAGDGRRAALVLVDPHDDLARAGLGLVPPDRRDDVVVLDVAERERPFGLNLLDAGLGWDRDKAVANVLAVFRREFDAFWGPRMEDAFRFAALTLVEANQTLCAADPIGRLRQHTILAVPPLLTLPGFRRTVLELVADPHVRAWWADYYDALDRRFQLEIANPVQTKVQRFVGSRIARAIVGQPRSTIDPGAWLREGKIVVIHTAKGVVGEDTAALLGATLLNLLALVVSEQAVLPPAQRARVNVLADELHTMPGADYETYLAELAKYGASLALATQSLERLAALDRAQQRALRATLFANLDGIFAFQTSAADAEYLARELGREIDAGDLLDLDDFQCYARISVGGERLPPFSVHLDPPPPGDDQLARELAVRSAAQYGRHWRAVERDLQASLDRIAQGQRRPADPGPPGLGGAGVPRDPAPAPGAGPAPSRGPRRGRNAHRPGKPTGHAPQASLFDADGASERTPGEELIASGPERSDAGGKIDGDPVEGGER